MFLLDLATVEKKVNQEAPGVTILNSGAEGQGYDLIHAECGHVPRGCSIGNTQRRLNTLDPAAHVLIGSEFEAALMRPAGIGDERYIGAAG